MIVLGNKSFFYSHYRFPLLSMILKDAISFIVDIRVISFSQNPVYERGTECTKSISDRGEVDGRRSYDTSCISTKDMIDLKTWSLKTKEV